ncbi:hypothetical protein [Klebsiella variicola]|uniref:hypothetical protein n=1 Tax=Klebsiella variicola TaxID=244366 RepID=UPI0022E8ACF5|nr:hypothetical protein [Klebsiella variicola]
MKNEVEQIALQNDMSIEFVTWFFNEKKVGCGNVWFMMMAAMWEGWKGRSIEMDKLATENVALKNVFSQKEIPSEAVDAFMETAVMDHDWHETSEWSWVENETEVIHAVLDALKPETPVTDAYLAGIKADGVEDEPFGFVSRNGDVVIIELNGDRHIRDGMPVFVKELREGADK